MILWNWIKENKWILLGGIGLIVLIWLLIGWLSDKVNTERKLKLADPYMRGKEVCELQQYLRGELRKMDGEDPEDFIIDDCIFGPSTQEALLLVEGKGETTLKEIGFDE